MQGETTSYVLLATAYGLFGASVSAFYVLSHRLRREPLLHVVTLLLFGVANLLVLKYSPRTFDELQEVHLGAQFFLFLTASLCYVPTIVFMVIHYWGIILERMLAPGSRREQRRAPESAREQMRTVRKYLELLAASPSNAVLRERLADLYVRMGFLDSAAYEYHRAAEWLERGYGHGKVLYKAAHTLASRKDDLDSAIPLLRRIVRLYPKSYFASYARRMINHYEAHVSVEGKRGGEERRNA